jgi:D-alanine transaminase
MLWSKAKGATLMMLLDNKLVSEKDVSIHYEDRGYQFGDGVYEVFRLYGGKIFELQGHLERLERSANEIRMELPISLSELSQKLEELVKVEGVQEGIIYLQVTRGYSPRSHPIPAQVQPVLTAYTKAVPRPHQATQNGVHAITVEDIRWLRCDIKSLNLLGSVLCKQQAVDAGVFESVLHRDGIVTEGSSTNVMMIENGSLVTHPVNHLILNGITRILVLDLARELGIRVIEEPFTLARLREADEAFFTGTTTEIAPLIKLDDRALGNGKPGTLTRRLQEALESRINQAAGAPR